MVNQSPMHAVHKLYEYRKSISTRPFNARGKNLVRCDHCLLSIDYCTCAYKRSLTTHASFLLLYADSEVLKPTNSGRLIADLIPDTHAFLWSRTQIDPKIIELINHEAYQPYLIFPSEYAAAEQEVVHHVSIKKNKTPLFILLDGSWREAVKIFRKSSYLHHLPMLSFEPTVLARYAIRKGQRDFQFGTAEVAAMALDLLGEENNAKAMNAWFDLFIMSTLLGRNRKPKSAINDVVSIINQFDSACMDKVLSDNDN